MQNLKSKSKIKFYRYQKKLLKNSGFSYKEIKNLEGKAIDLKSLLIVKKILKTEGDLIIPGEDYNTILKAVAFFITEFWLLEFNEAYFLNMETKDISKKIDFLTTKIKNGNLDYLFIYVPNLTTENLKILKGFLKEISNIPNKPCIVIFRRKTKEKC